MSHFDFIVNGLPEAIARFQGQMDRFPLGNGMPPRLREWRFFDLQYDSKDEDQVMSEFYFNLEQGKFIDGHAYKFMKNESPFKHGKLRFMINLFSKTMAPFGVEPVEPWKHKFKHCEGDKIVYKTGVPLKAKVDKRGMNIYVLGKVKDNFVTEEFYGRTKELL